jgi:hypothetical protein
VVTRGHRRVIYAIVGQTLVLSSAMPPHAQPPWGVPVGVALRPA